MTGTQWLDDLYLAVRIIAAIVASLLAVYLTPLPDLWKGFALGVLLSTFTWLFLYFYRQEKRSVKCAEDEVPHSHDVASDSVQEDSRTGKGTGG